MEYSTDWNGRSFASAAWVVPATVAAYAIARAVAVRAARQTDVIAKSPTHHYDDVKIAILGVLVLAYMFDLPPWPVAVSMLVAAAVFAYVSDLKPLQASLAAPTLTLKLTAGALGVVLVTGVAAMLTKHTNERRTFAYVAAAVGAYTLAEFAAARIPPSTPVHFHHTGIGLGIAALAAPFDDFFAHIVAGIGLAVWVHGNAVYTPTTNFCGIKTPCANAKYRDVPRVAV
jgi:hypothetical protein